MADQPGFLTALEERDESFAGTVAATRTAAMSDGALDAKTKTLIAMCLDAGMNHPDGAAALADRARDRGATEAEVTEAIEVVTALCGLQGLASGAGVFAD